MPNYAPDPPSLAPGAGPTFHAAAAGDTFDNNGSVLLWIKNAGGSPSVVTINAAGMPSGPPGAKQFDADVDVSVPATTGERVIGPFPPSRFNNDDGRVELAWSFTTSVTWAAVRAQ
jgi:hypothetical protein